MIDKARTPLANGFALDTLYEGHLPNKPGASLEFLMPHGNIIYVFIRSINKLEKKALKRGDIRLGILHKGPALVVIVQFLFKGKSVLSYDCTYDARVIPDIKVPEHVPGQHLLFNVVAVEANNSVIKALRSLTMSAQTTELFLSAVNEQLSTQDDGSDQVHEWLSLTGAELIKKATMRETGATEDLIPLDIDKPESGVD